MIEALLDPPVVHSRDYAWTVVDAVTGQVRQAPDVPYLFGKLVKYDPDAVVDVVDEETHRVRSQITPDLVQAESAFIYLSTEACFSHQHVWNQVRPSDFRNRIREIIKAYYSDFFVDCELNPIVEMQRFAQRLAELTEIHTIRASVKPPNPLFGPHWRRLKEYLTERRARQIKLREESVKGESLNSTLSATAQETLVQSNTTSTQRDTPPLPTIDAAVLMAADGYGSAEITGKSGNTVHVIRTTDNVVELKLPPDSPPDDLAAVTYDTVMRLNSDRSLQHPPRPE